MLGDLQKAKHSSAVAGADHVGVHPPHDYGLAVTLLNIADRLVPPDQVAPLAKGIDGFLLASSLAVTDPPKAPVFLLHGVDDNVIPSVETVLLAEHLKGKVKVEGLLSGLITHAEVNRTANFTEVWRLARFWKDVMAQ